MLLSAVSVLVVAQSSSEIPEGLTNNPVYEKRREYFSVFNYRTPSVQNVAFPPLGRVNETF